MSNKEWLFSGVAIAIPLAVLGVVFNKGSSRQHQKIGDHSEGYQSGRDIKVERRADDV